MNTIPKEITEGYPKKVYTFTGEWVETQDGGRNTAARNRKTYRVPVYKSEDGERILYMPYKEIMTMTLKEAKELLLELSIHLLKDNTLTEQDINEYLNALSMARYVMFTDK